MALDALSSPPVKATKPTTALHPAAASPITKGVSAKIPKKKLASSHSAMPKPATTKPATPKPITHEKSVKVTKPVKKSVEVVRAEFPNLNRAANDAKAKEAEKKPETKTGPKKIPSSPAATPGAKQRLSEAANQSSTAMQKSLSRGRTLSSPLKPSPLGSSPPTNASEFDNHHHNHHNNNHDAGSSSSITPALILPLQWQKEQQHLFKWHQSPARTRQRPRPQYFSRELLPQISRTFPQRLRHPPQTQSQ